MNKSDVGPTTRSNVSFAIEVRNNAWQYDEQLSFIISSLMFTYGDSDQPLEMCKEFLLNLLYGQLKAIICNAHKLATERNRRNIGYAEIVFAFRRHPLLIQRLIVYMRMKDHMTSLLRSCELDNESKIDATLATTSSTFDGAKKEFSNSKLKDNCSVLIAAIKEFDVTGHLLAGVDDTATHSQAIDATKMRRMQWMAERTGRMDAKLYERFSEARQTSFISRRGKMLPIYEKKFLEWLEAPPTEPGVVHILNFCATEIAAIIVECAVFCREKEGIEVRDPKQPLQLRHYEDALSRNRGYANRKDILFGYF